MTKKKKTVTVENLAVRTALADFLASFDVFTRSTNRISALVDSPTTKARLALLRRLEAACKDKTIMASQASLAIAQTMRDFVGNAPIRAGVGKVFEPLTTQAAKQAISNDKRKAAALKNFEPRQWVFKEWGIRTDKGQSKASFARQHAPLVKKKFSLNVTPETIARDWLPKAKK